MKNRILANTQLIDFAKRYLTLASDLSCEDKDLDTKICVLFDQYGENRRSPIYLFMAHLASSAIRLYTLVDYKENRLSQYKLNNRKGEVRVDLLKSNIGKYIVVLLRDMIGHGVDTDCKISKARDEVIHNMTPRECHKYLHLAATDIEKQLMDNKSASADGAAFAAPRR